MPSRSAVPEVSFTVRLVGGGEEEDDGSEEEAWGAKEEWARVWAPVEVEEGKGDSKRHSHSGRRWIVRVVEVGC